MINRVGIVVWSGRPKFVVHAETVQFRGLIVLHCHFHLEKVALIPVGPVAGPKRVLQQVQVVLELARETHVELSQHLFPHDHR